MWGHGLTWPAILFRRYYTSTQPHAEPSKVTQATGPGMIFLERRCGVANFQES